MHVLNIRATELMLKSKKYIIMETYEETLSK